MIERELTGLMYELLSPEENPERGRLYLELFDKNILRLNMTAAELDSAEIHGQYKTELLAKKEKVNPRKIPAAKYIFSMFFWCSLQLSYSSESSGLSYTSCF